MNENDEVIDRIPVFKFQKNSYEKYIEAYMSDSLVQCIADIEEIKEDYFSEANSFIAVSDRALKNLLVHLQTNHEAPEFTEYPFEEMNKANDIVENIAIKLANGKTFNLNEEYDQNKPLQAVYTRKSFKDEVIAREDIFRGYDQEYGAIEEIDRELIDIKAYSYRNEDEFNDLHNIDEIYQTASKLVCDVLKIDQLKYSPKKVVWTKKAYKSYFGIARGIDLYTKGYKKGFTKENIAIEINSILCSSNIPREVIEFVIYHELLHFELLSGHTVEFREYERKYPKYSEVEAVLSEIEEWVDLHFDDAKKKKSKKVIYSDYISNKKYGKFTLYSKDKYRLGRATTKYIQENNLKLPSFEELSELDDEVKQELLKDSIHWVLLDNCDEAVSISDGKKHKPKNTYILIKQKGEN